MNFTPTQFSTAADKEKFYLHFIKFVSSGFKPSLFHSWFYHQLSSTFGHIAHYNLHGFYNEFFQTTEGQARFIELCSMYPCYGSPLFTYCDVERALQAWIKENNALENSKKRHLNEIETAEYKEYLRLKAKYEPK